MSITLLPSSFVGVLPSSPPAWFVSGIGIPKQFDAPMQSLALTVPLTVTPSPTPSSTSAPEPTPTVTVTVTETAPASTSPSTVLLEGEQFSALTVGLVLAVMLLTAILISQMRRP